MNEDISDGWTASAAAWIVEQGEDGDYGRRFVLDAPMRARIEGRGFRNALDVGCGEGRFCRIMQRAGIRTTGIDPTEALLARAMELDPQGDYRLGRAETMRSKRHLIWSSAISAWSTCPISVRRSGRSWQRCGRAVRC
jgi:SAM-dependent methyltransferase|nr:MULTISPECIES: methyltransferase domain-containing protein [unclassified Bradyrhizobium]